MHSSAPRASRAVLVAFPATLLSLMLGCATAKPDASAGTSPTPQTTPASMPPAAPAAAHVHAPDSAAASTPAAGGHAHMPGMAPIVVPPGALYTKADVEFMQGMIAHHAQAIHMSRLAATRGANPRLLRFAMKIDQSQRAEIEQMQQWLVAHKQMAPDTNSHKHMMMDGMLTPAQLAGLEAAKGLEFDRQFLVLMIQHHEGAIKMVKDLFASPRAAQDVDVSVFANDVETVQSAEIALMRQMLADL